MDPQKILDYGAKLIVIFMCIPIHEYAHAWAATKLGDDTPRYQGRLSLNPLAHLDPIGALCIFFIGFGWGKPVQVNPIRFKNYRKGMALTAAAGPISNIIMGLIGIVLYKLFYVGEGADKKELIKSLTMNVRRGEHVAIIGANGIGKTSILKLIQGIIPHEGGNISWGGNVKISYFEQEHAILDPHKTVLEEIMDRYPRLSEQQARSVLGAVLLTGENVFKPISVLSGGERAKLCFAIMALNRGNVLVLDEPTNHLDLSTKEVLEDALAEFGGTIILVSHDRYLLNKVASRIIEIKHDEVNSYEGNFDAYSEAVNAARQLKMQSEAEIKRAEEEKAYKENKARQYRSKEQRAADAQKRNRIRELEKEIEDTEVLIFELENAISDPEIASDYSKMSEKCKELEEAKTALDQKMDEWAELSDQLS